MSGVSKQMFYKITQVRSTIGLPPKIRKNIEALGLKRRNHTVFQSVSPSTAHRLAAVKEIVNIELVDQPKTAAELSLERKFKPGFEIVKGNMLASRN